MGDKVTIIRDSPTLSLHHLVTLSSCDMKIFALTLGFILSLATLRAEEATARDARELWAGYDPRAESLEIEVAKAWDEDAIHLEQLSFTGEMW